MESTEFKSPTPLKKARRPTLQWLAGGLTVLALGGVALLALPAVTFAKSDPTADPGAPATVSDCQTRVSTGEFPRLTKFLSGLVSDGVVSQDQSDQIDARFRDQAEYVCMEHLLFPKREAITVTADATDAKPREVLRSLVGSGTVAGYASDHGIDEPTLINELLAAPKQRAAALVASGDISQDEANDLLSDVQTYIGQLIHAEGVRGFRQTRW